MARSSKKCDKISIKMIVTLLATFLFAAPAEAFFRLLCFNPLGFGRIDPIVSPDKPATHVHHLHGSGNLGMHSTDAQYLLESNCTSCSVTVDKSTYWAPAMYFHHENGDFELMNTSSAITIYYKTEKRVNFLDQNYTAFPKGFRMVAGNAARRHWVGPWPIPAQSFWGEDDTTQEALSAKALGFNCLNYERGFDEATFAYPYLRDRGYIDDNCSEGIRAEVLFPSCWDGIHLGSQGDHQSHVAYPTLLQDGACPITHPVYLPVLFYETIWNTQAFKGVPGQFVFSNGDPTGFGYHADFMAAWEDGVLERVMADPNCTDQDIFNRHSDGLQEHCPVFASNIQSQEKAAGCKLQEPEMLARERVVGPIPTLPGNLKVTGVRHDPGTMPEDFPAGQNAPSPPAQPITPPVSSVAPPAATAAVSPTLSASLPVTGTVTPNATVTHTVGPVISTSRYTSNGVLYEIDIVQSWVTEYKTVTPTLTATTTVRHKRHVHGHKHHNVV